MPPLRISASTRGLPCFLSTFTNLPFFSTGLTAGIAAALQSVTGKMDAVQVQPRSLLPVVAAADNFPPFHEPYPTRHPITTEAYVPLHLTLADHLAGLPPIGLLRPDVLAELRLLRSPHFVEHLGGAPGEDGRWKPETHCVYLADDIIEEGPEGVGEVIQSLAEKWKREGKFPGPLGADQSGWRNEQYMIYAHPQSSMFAQRPMKAFENAAFQLERAACAVFGLATFGVHMTAYEGSGSDMKIWVPRRSPTKATWPSMLDNSVAGGIPAGMAPLDCIVKECDEEASLPEDLVRGRIKNAGVVTYFYITNDGFLQPEVEFIYDLPLPPQDSPQYVKPRPHDDEVESFAVGLYFGFPHVTANEQLLTLPEVLEALYAGQFKPNCGLILVDFLMRHGLVTPETEPNYIEIRQRMSRYLGVALPSI